jgi:hypothetical protein
VRRHRQVVLNLAQNEHPACCAVSVTSIQWWGQETIKAWVSCRQKLCITKN